MTSTEVKQRRGEILTGNIVKTLFTLSWPVMVSSALWIVYSIIDAFWIGKARKGVMAAVSASWPVFFLCFAVAIGLASAGVSLVSQYTGAGEHETARKAAAQTFTLLLTLGTGVGLIGFFGVHWFLAHIIRVPKDILPMATTYMQINFLGLPFIYTLATVRFLLRGIGDMKTPMYLRALYIFLNILFDPFLILGFGPFPRLGVEGVALGIVSTRSLAAVVGSYLLFTGKGGIDLKLKDLKPNFHQIKKIINIGAPATVARSGNALSFVLVMSFISQFGAIPMSAYGFGRRITRLINISTWGFAGSVMTMAGQNIGAKQKERGENIVRKASLSAGLIMFSTATIIFFTRFSIMKLFTNTMPVVMAGATFISIYVFSIPFYGFFRIFDATYRGTGHTKSAMILSLTRVGALRVGLPYLLAFNPLGIGLGLGIVGVWWGMALSNIIGAFTSFIWFLIGKWKEKTIETKGEENGETERR